LFLWFVLSLLFCFLGPFSDSCVSPCYSAVCFAFLVFVFVSLCSFVSLLVSLRCFIIFFSNFFWFWFASFVVVFAVLSCYLSSFLWYFLLFLLCLFVWCFLSY
jgi:hypothetical protein